MIMVVQTKISNGRKLETNLICEFTFLIADYVQTFTLRFPMYNFIPWKLFSKLLTTKRIKYPTSDQCYVNTIEDVTYSVANCYK